MGPPTSRTVRAFALGAAVCAVWGVAHFSGCAAGEGGGAGDDDDATTTATATPTGSGGLGGTAGTGGTTATGTTTGGTGGTAGTGGGTGGNVGGAGTGGSTTAQCSHGSPVCILHEWDFDSGCATGWTANGTNRDWACGTPTYIYGPPGDCEGGGELWGTNLTGNAETCQSSYLVSPEVDLSSYQGETVQLSFYHWYDFRECAAGPTFCNILTNWMSYSGGRIEVNSGSGWTSVTPQGGYEVGGKTVDCSSSQGGSPPCGGADCAVDESTQAYTCGGVEKQWHQGVIDISAHTTSTFQVRFVFGSNDIDPIMFLNRAGWYIDNVAIVVPGACP